MRKVPRFLHLSSAAFAVIFTGCWSGPGQRTSPEGPVNYRNDRITFSNSNVSDLGNSKKAVNSNGNESKDVMKRFVVNLPAGFEQPSSDVGRKLLKEYGAVFVARGGITAPTKVIFRDGAEVTAFQMSIKTSAASIGGLSMVLQASAMEGLRAAISQANSKGLTITPRGGDSAKRTYEETIGLWESRVEPALVHWVGKGRLTRAEADRIRAMSTYEQVEEVLRLEDQGIWFAKDLSKSIIYSVAPPGTSQHLSMLAFDVKEHDNVEVRRILNENGWFQTVVSDLPHFTFLGVKEKELSDLGLKKRSDDGRTYWVPDI